MGFIPLSRLSEYLREYPEERKRFFIDPNNPADDKYREYFAKIYKEVCQREEERENEKLCES